MNSETPFLSSRSPELVAEIAGLLGRMGRADLATQVGVFPVERVTQDRRRSRLSFLRGAADRAYSVELEAMGVLITVDVSRGEDLIAVHVGPPED